jgi:hypothetical protein
MLVSQKANELKFYSIMKKKISFFLKIAVITILFTALTILLLTFFEVIENKFLVVFCYVIIFVSLVCILIYNRKINK